jgi:hypothetical protein
VFLEPQLFSSTEALNSATSPTIGLRRARSIAVRTAVMKMPRRSRVHYQLRPSYHIECAGPKAFPGAGNGEVRPSSASATPARIAASKMPSSLEHSAGVKRPLTASGRGSGADSVPRGHRAWRTSRREGRISQPRPTAGAVSSPTWRNGPCRLSANFRRSASKRFLRHGGTVLSMIDEPIMFRDGSWLAKSRLSQRFFAEQGMAIAPPA